MLLYLAAVSGFCLYRLHAYQLSFEEIQPYSHYYETTETETETLSETLLLTETLLPSDTFPESEKMTKPTETETVSETLPVTTAAEITEQPEISPETDPVPEIQFPLELNHASLEELCAIPQIGTVKAQNIIDYREAHGGFQNCQQLLEVSGIGETIYQQILSYVYLETEYFPPEQEQEQEIIENTEMPEPDPTEPPDETLPPEIPVINLNTATKEQLLLLPDCDEALADEILVLRDRDIHVFYHILEITLAEHVTPELFQKWEAYLTVSDDGSTQIPYTRYQNEENQD